MKIGDDFEEGLRDDNLTTPDFMGKLTRELL